MKKSYSVLWMFLAPAFIQGCNQTADPNNLCGFEGFSASSTKEEAPINRIRKANRSPKKFIVKMKTNSVNGLTASAMIKTEVPANAVVEEIKSNLYSIDFSDATDAKRYTAELRANRQVSYVEPDYKIYVDFTPNDPQLGRQWSHVAVKSSEAWEITQGTDVLVGVIDTGIDTDHPDLKSNIYKNPGEISGNGIDDDNNGFIDDVFGWNFIDNNSNAEDDNLHGSHVAGIIGATTDNNYGMAGQSPHVKLMALKFLNSDGEGDTSAAVKAIQYAVANGVKILNASWGGTEFSQALKDAIEEAKNAGVLFVSAAGNDGTNNDSKPHYPASYGLSNMITVASSSCKEQLSSFSNYGAKTVHLAAPGEKIFSTLNQGRFGFLSGTSMATPVVAGVAALVRGLRPDLSPEQVKTAIESNVDVLAAYSKTSSGGRLNAVKTLRAVSPPQSLAEAARSFLIR